MNQAAQLNHRLWEAIVFLDADEAEQALAAGADSNATFEASLPDGLPVLHRSHYSQAPDWTPLVGCMHPDGMLHAVSGMTRDDQQQACAQIITLLLRHGADPNIRLQKEPKSILMHAYHLDDAHPAIASAVGLLVSACSDETIQWRNGGNDETALHQAAYRQRVELTRALLARGADPNARDRTGAAPLWTLASEENLKSEAASIAPFDTIAMMLLAAGASIAPHPFNGRTLLMEYSFLDVEKWEARGVDPLYQRADGWDLRWQWVKTLLNRRGNADAGDYEKLLALVQRDGMDWDATFPGLGKPMSEIFGGEIKRENIPESFLAPFEAEHARRQIAKSSPMRPASTKKARL